MPRTPGAKLVAEPGPGGPRYRRKPKSAPKALPDSPAAKRDSRSRALALDPSNDRIVRYLPAAVLARVEDAIDTALRAPTDVKPPPQVLPADEEPRKDPVTDEGMELDVAVPLGRIAWCSEPVAPEARRFGSHSDPGPATAESDKGNQDFAFHLELDAAEGVTWVLAGVADGVSQATWAARGARHAAGAFIEAFADLAAHVDFPRDEIRLAGDAWAQTFARLFHERVMGRLTRDREALLAERRVDATWSPELFGRVFWTGPDVEKERGKWFQSTLLAAALGPDGGFALFLGDGFARIDRRGASGAWQSSSTVPSSPPVSFGLTRQLVFNNVMRLAARGAAEMGVMVTTDGVSKSSGEGLTRAMEGLGRLPGSAPGAPLETFAPASSLECRTFLRRLATLGGDLADIDNMSVAFASRTLEAPRAP